MSTYELVEASCLRQMSVKFNDYALMGEIYDSNRRINQIVQDLLTSARFVGHGTPDHTPSLRSPNLPPPGALAASSYLVHSPLVKAVTMRIHSPDELEIQTLLSDLRKHTFLAQVTTVYDSIELERRFP